ncbi:MAG: hypothetical protein HUU45_04455, partial [Leptospiraceae bacterium]|nr:hypothetical protein [Leptospiraceae bacterium]
LNISEENKPRALEAARLAMNNGANAELKDNKDKSPIDYAEKKGFSELISILKKQ